MLKRRLPALFFLLLALSLGAAAYNARIVRLSLSQGDVELDRNVGQGVERAIMNTPITAGMRLDTFEGARAEVEFENGGTVRLAGPASITFRELSMTGNGDKITGIDVSHGTVYFDIHHKGDDRFVVSVLGQTVTLDKSAQLRIVADEQVATVAVFKGEAWLDGRGERATIKKNETLTLDMNEPDRYFLAKDLEPLEEDQWNKSRDAERDQYANASGYQYSNTSYGAPYSYGINDMLAYGSYFNAPGYGWLWRPSMFGVGWDPFSSGMWSYYPGAGYVFVSQYPWGWTPYRYGRWVFVDGRGWCWSSQGGYSSWNVVPVVARAPRGWVPLQRPAGNGPTLFVHDRMSPPRPDPQHYVGHRLPAGDMPRRVTGPEARTDDPRTHDRRRITGGKLQPAPVTPNQTSPATAGVKPQQPARREPVVEDRDAWRGDPSRGGESWRHPARQDDTSSGAVVRPGKNTEEQQDRRVERSVPPSVRPDRDRGGPQRPTPPRETPGPAPRVEREQPAPQQPVRVEPARPAPAPRMEAPRPAPQVAPSRPASPRMGFGSSERMDGPRMSSPGVGGGQMSAPRGGGGHRGH